MFVKSISKVLTRKPNANGEDFVLETGSKLGDSFNKLPHGIINKTETGIGATTLELKADRNSIIVEPIKVTASSKAKKHNALYIGSITLNHPKKITKKDIVDYLDNQTILYKKIIVVADSLYRITDLIRGNEQDYFLMIDEADSFQNDSGFRRSMELCIDTYKTFPIENRALVTATMLSFSDPFFDHEKRTEIKFVKPGVRTIALLRTQWVNAVTVEHISRIAYNDPTQKIMIAYNSVSGCYDIAKHLVDHGGFVKQDINILCSVNSKDSCPEFFVELDKEILPARINFITSAYFSGFDLEEDLHLISITSNQSKAHALSNHKLKQIAGRCRKKLLSETIIYQVNVRPSKNKIPSKQDLIHTAEQEIHALNCIDRNYSSNYILNSNLKEIRSLIITKTTADGFQLVRQNRLFQPVVAYLNIDALIETDRVMNTIYNTPYGLPQLLRSDGHILTSTLYTPTTVVIQNKVEVVVRESMNQAIIDALRKSTSREEITELLEHPGLKKSQKELINAYLMNFAFVDKTALLNKLQTTVKCRDSRKLNNITLEVMFGTLDANNLYKRNVNRHLVIGSTYTPAELLIQWNKILEETGLQKQLTSDTTATKLTYIHFDVTRNGKKGTHKLKGPLSSIKIKKTRSEETTIMSLLEDAIHGI